MDSWENIIEFTLAEEATTYDNLLLDGSISNADVRDGHGYSGFHRIPMIGSDNKDVGRYDNKVYIDTDILISYLLTCDPPADVNGRDNYAGETPMRVAA